MIAVADATGDEDTGRQERWHFVTAFTERDGFRQECFDQLWWTREKTLRQLAGTPQARIRAEIAGAALDTHERLLGTVLDHHGALTVPDDAPLPQLCFTLQEEVRARDLLADLAHGPLPVPAAVPPALAEEEASLLSALHPVRTRSALASGDAATSRVASMLYERLAGVREQIRPHAPGHARLRDGEPLDVAGAQDLLARHAPPGGMVLASYFCGADALYCTVLTSDGAPSRVRRVPLGRARLAELAARLRHDINGDPHAAPPTPAIRARRPWKRDLAYLAELTPLMAPFEDLLDGYPLLAVAGHGPLAGLPFVAVPRADGRRLGETTAVVSVPGASALSYLLAEEATTAATAVTVGCGARENPDMALFEEDDALLRSGPWTTAAPLTGTGATPVRCSTRWAVRSWPM